ncbi:MAG: ribosome maturation factor RimM [Gammaproteobacteria bacterium]|nr:ribosome maturation factor RimM [Gammaproteobacteria bacterium]
MTARENRLAVGRVSGLHGVSGWIKVYSYTDPPDNIFEYQPWVLDYSNAQHEIAVVDSRRNGRVLLAKFADIADRDQAAVLVNAEIFVAREQLPAPQDGQYYWADLLGMQVISTEGIVLGEVSRLFETGANDVMVVVGQRERLIPWIKDKVIDDVDLATRQIRVRWDPEF